MMEASESPLDNSPTIEKKKYNFKEGFGQDDSSTDKNSFSDKTLSTTQSFESEKENDISLRLLTMDSPIPSSLLSEEETLENLIQSSSAFLKDLDLPTLGGNLLNKNNYKSTSGINRRNGISKSITQTYENGVDSDDGNFSHEDYEDSHEDEMLDDLSKLAAAEEGIRRELEMVMNTGFGGFKSSSQIDKYGNDNLYYEDSKQNENLSVGFEFSSTSAHKSKHKRRKKKLLQSLSVIDIQDRKITSPGTPKNKSTEWRKQGEEIGIQRILQEEANDNFDEVSNSMGVYKIPLPNSIYDLVMDQEMGNDPDSLPSKNENIDSAKLSPNSSSNSSSLSMLSPQQKEILFQCNSEYVLPLSSKSLRRTYVGLLPARTTASTQAQREDMNNPLAFLRDLILSRVPKNHSIEQELKEQHENSQIDDCQEPFPIRTCTLRIRPDVLCGAVMDALSHVVMAERNGEIMKRQGGHLIAVLPGIWLKKKKKKRLSHADSDNEENLGDDYGEIDLVYSELGDDIASPQASKKKKETKKKRKVFLPPLCLDAQLCTKKRGSPIKDHCERILLIRLYEIKDNSKEYVPILDPMEEKNSEYGKENNDEVKEKYSDEYDTLRDAAYVLHQMRCEADGVSGVNDAMLSSEPQFSDTKSLEKLKDDPKHSSSSNDENGYVFSISNMLTTSMNMFSSVTDPMNSNLIKPPNREMQQLAQIFSPSKHTLHQSAFRFLTACISELETRELLYTTLLLPRSKFGQFPALPTLDVQYCFQLRVACREAMIMNLLKTAASLEQFTRESEMESLEFVKVLVEGSMKDYGMDEPKVPQLVPLSGFPLNYEPPEVKNPPWGQKVIDALQEISLQNSNLISGSDSQVSNAPLGHNLMMSSIDLHASKEPEIGDEPAPHFDRAREAVQKVIKAFCKQDDGELAARVSRKNLQVMDRLLKMEGLKKRVVKSIGNSYGRNTYATNAGNHFHSMAQKATDPTAKLKEFHLPGHDPSYTANDTAPAKVYFAPQQVPILKCGMLVKDAPGTCYITEHQMLFATNVGFLSGDIYAIVSIDEIHLDYVDNGTNIQYGSTPDVALSVRMHQKLGQEVSGLDKYGLTSNSVEVFSFVPSVPAEHFKFFFDTLKRLNEEKRL